MIVLDFLMNYWFEISAGLAALGLFIYATVLSRRLKAYKKLTTLLKGGSVEEHICKLEERCDSQEQAIAALNSEIDYIKSQISKVPHNWHLLRYNAFEKTGSDLSFSFALLNDDIDGIVLTGIFGREDTRVYAKPVTGGKSEYTLSDEETKAIKAAVKK